jgi:hypothetical protein
MENEKHVTMEIINPFAAGIEISVGIILAIGQGERCTRAWGL